MLVYVLKLRPHSRPKSSSRTSLCHAWRRERASEVDYRVPRATMLLASTHDNLTECHGIACEQALHLGDIVKSTRARGTREETSCAAGSRSTAIVSSQQSQTFSEQNLRKWLVNDF